MMCYSARTDELPDEFATKDVAREIMLEHVRGWDVPVMDYLDGVRASLLQDLSDLLSEHFSAVPGMRLVISYVDLIVLPHRSDG